MGKRPLEVAPEAAELASLLNARFTEAKFSQARISRELSISRPRVAAILDASSAMTVSELLQLSAMLGLEPGQLLAEAEARLAAATEPTPTEEVAEVHTLPIHRRDIPPIPEGLAARRVPSSPAEDEEELPDFSQMAARTVSDEQYQRIMARKKFLDNLGEGVDYDPDGWAD